MLNVNKSISNSASTIFVVHNVSSHEIFHLFAAILIENSIENRVDIAADE